MDIKLPISVKFNDIELSDIENSIKTSIRNIVSTSSGSRPFKPYMGINYQILYSKGTTTSSFNYLRSFIENSLTILEPRIKILAVSIGFAPNSISDIIVDVDYNIPGLDKNSQTNITFSL